MSASPPGPGTQHLGPLAYEHSYQRFRLVVTDGPDRGSVAVAAGEEITVGTAEGNELRLTDPAVSRHHAVFVACPQGFSLRDLGSTNGTWIAGCRIEAALVRPGVRLRLGQSTLRLEDLAERVVEPLSEASSFGRALGASPAMRRLFALLPRVAASDSTVLLEGETGTGKTLLAEAIHHASPRARGRFSVLDCSTIPPTLIESELFGHERGAFTGATSARAGAFEAARGGTLFLDEVGELPLEMQPKLLRALEERLVRRIGSQDQIKLDVRVIAATNRELRTEVNAGRFRSDLFYRLNTVRLRMPPLRQRREDISLLVAHYYEQFTGHPGDLPPPELVQAFVRMDWPGNVRELRAAVERAVLMGGAEEPVEEDPSSSGEASEGPPLSALADYVFDPALPFRDAKERAIGRWERWYVRELVRRSRGNLSEAARLARTDRQYLRSRLRKYGLTAQDDSED